MFTILPLDTLFYIAKPMVSEIILDIILNHSQDKQLNEIKTNLCSFITKFTKKQHIFYDADIHKVINSLMDDTANFEQHGEQLLQCLEDWVRADTTQFDYDRIKPSLECFKLATVKGSSYSVKIVDDANASQYDLWKNQHASC